MDGSGAERDRGRVPIDPGRRPAGARHALQGPKLAGPDSRRAKLLLITRRQVIPSILVVVAGSHPVMVHDRLFSSFLRKTVTRLGLSLALSRLLRRRLWRIRLRRGLLGLRFSSLLVLAAGGISAVLFRGVGPLVTASEERGRDDDPNEAQERH